MAAERVAKRPRSDPGAVEDSKPFCTEDLATLLPSPAAEEEEEELAKSAGPFMSWAVRNLPQVHSELDKHARDYMFMLCWVQSVPSALRAGWTVSCAPTDSKWENLKPDIVLENTSTDTNIIVVEDKANTSKDTPQTRAQQLEKYLNQVSGRYPIGLLAASRTAGAFWVVTRTEQQWYEAVKKSSLREALHVAVRHKPNTSFTKGTKGRSVAEATADR